jgi:hypothetical protein
MTKFEQVMDRVNDMVAEMADNMDQATAEELGLDTRVSIRTFYVSRDGILVEGNTSRLDYYGGFEYVGQYDPDAVQKLGDWTMYTSASERVRGHLYRVLDADTVAELQAEYDELEEEE